ncbi:hypothetical protein HanHA300_Chr09g0332221 [Helianthus annuus]|nr:hypothetical protein HanHA300_Chr09g0332221 [Helianthus annuus]KAJ0543675.1 hypothetical protein HanHA89_Chr09g0353211 [Helianthus annuus]KAJ0708730.1 hypothetical protein HanLR1_Chr09g0332531 [Helianthus annuus]KAJ0712644.1 hypothetical protein HanOQP8_Chr09g0337051 [Helianthus annuus]
MVPQSGVVSVGVHIVLPPVSIHLIHIHGGLTILGPVTNVSAFFTYGVLHRTHFLFLHASQLPLQRFNSILRMHKRLFTD